MTSVSMNSPVQVVINPIDLLEVGLAIVNFRPKSGWNGEFGFDWLRIEDDSYDGTARNDNFQRFLHSGYKYKVAAPAPAAAGAGAPAAIVRPAVNMQKADALIELAKAYKKTKIERPIPVADFNSENYYSSYLNLYSAGGVEEINIANMLRTVPTGGKVLNTVPPPNKAELRVSIEVIADIDKIELEYDKEWFTIDKSVLVQKMTAAAAGDPATKLDVELKISCQPKKAEPQQINGKLVISPPQPHLMEDGFSTKKEIIAWAYPKDSNSLSAEDQKKLRRLAGRIIVLPNNDTRRKHIDIVYVNARLDVDGSGKTGLLPLTAGIVNHIQNTLYQSLVDGTIIAGPELDLSADPMFKSGTPVIGSPTTTAKPTNTFVYPTGEIYSTIDKETVNEALYEYLEKEYVNQHPEYRNYFFVFYMDAEAILPLNATHVISLFGQVREVNRRSVILFQNYQTPNNIANNCVASHEILHGLGLHHSFPNKSLDKVPLYQEQKFVFRQSTPEQVDTATGAVTSPELITSDNIMDYPPSTQVATWHWQWKIVNP